MADKVRLHFNGTNGSTTITDSVGVATWSVAAAAALSTAQQKFGTASLGLGSGGGGGNDVHSTNIGALPASGGWTIDFWMRPTAINDLPIINWVNNGSALPGVSINLQSSGSHIKISLGNTTGSDIANQQAGTKVISTNTWYHVALVRDDSAGKYFLYVDGVVDITATSALQIAANIDRLIIGNQWSGGSSFPGFIDEFHIADTCLYPNGTTFTAPTAEWPEPTIYTMTGSGGAIGAGSAPVEFVVPFCFTMVGSGGAIGAGAADVVIVTPLQLTWVGSGGAIGAGTATVEFYFAESPENVGTAAVSFAPMTANAFGTERVLFLALTAIAFDSNPAKFLPLTASASDRLTGSGAASFLPLSGLAIGRGEPAFAPLTAVASDAGIGVGSARFEPMSTVDTGVVLSTFMPLSAVASDYGIGHVAVSFLPLGAAASESRPISFLPLTGFATELGTISFLPMTARGVVLPGVDVTSPENPRGDPFPGWAVNYENNAPSRYLGLPANSIGQHKGMTYIANAAGIYALDSEDDAGVEIRAGITIGKTNYGSTRNKSFPNVWLGIRTSTPMRVTAITNNAGPYHYPTEGVHDGDLRQVRAQVGKGLEGAYWTWRVENVGGANFDIRTMELPPAILRRHGT